MTVAIQKGLEGIKRSLTDKGYHMVYYDEYKHPIDAYIYNGHSNDSAFGNVSFQLSSASNINHSNRTELGVLIINAENKKISEIEYMLNTKCYKEII